MTATPRKISEMPPATVIADADLLPIVDVSESAISSKNKKVTVAQILASLPDGAITSAKIADGAIVDADINASAAIADTKLATIATAGKVSNSATTATNANTASAIVARDGSGNFSAGTITAALAGNASTVTTNANLTGDVTSVGNATSIAAGVVVDADVNASAGIAYGKLALTGSIVNADVNASAGIVSSKLSFTQTGTGVVARTVDSKLKDVVSVNDFGAVGDGVADDTAAFNLALRASETYGDSIKHICLQLNGGDYRIDGTIYLRKGQVIEGGGAHLFMGATGSIKFGFKSDNTQDPGGAPPGVHNLWIEGGFSPINATVSGYQVSNLFFSFPSAGAVFGGSDGTISDCIFDAGSALCSLSGNNMTLTNCNFYVGTDQLILGDCKDSVISNCVFNYANNSSIRWAGQTGTSLINTRVINCSFMKNEQSVATFNGFVCINNVTTAPAGDLTISNCNFRNCAGGAIRNYGTATHRLTVENCVFDGTKTVSVYAQSSTMFALDMATSGFSKGITVLRNCEFRNLFDTPIKLSSAEAFNVSIQGCTFSGNAGSQSINIAVAPTTAVLEIGNCVGDFTSNVPLINFSDDLDFRVNGWLKRWLPIIDDGVTNRYVEVPFVGPALVKAVLIANQNPGGSSFYRTIKEITASATYDYTSQLATRASIQDDFASASPTLGFNLNIQVAVTNVATGTTVNGVLSPGKLVLYWPRTYGDSSIDVQYVHSSVKPA